MDTRSHTHTHSRGQRISKRRHVEVRTRLSCILRGGVLGRGWAQLGVNRGGVVSGKEAYGA